MCSLQLKTVFYFLSSSNNSVKHVTFANGTLANSQWLVFNGMKWCKEEVVAIGEETAGKDHEFGKSRGSK